MNEPTCEPEQSSSYCPPRRVASLDPDRRRGLADAQHDGQHPPRRGGLRRATGYSPRARSARPWTSSRSEDAVWEVYDGLGACGPATSLLPDRQIVIGNGSLVVPTGSSSWPAGGIRRRDAGPPSSVEVRAGSTNRQASPAARASSPRSNRSREPQGVSSRARSAR
jgi:hypothetical protein